ncbi:MAG: pyridoxal phosphate-dependent aminotransferase, partial [Dehalococcoidia bacterium]
MKVAKRMSNLGTETAFEVLVKANALAAKGVDVVHLELGEPDFDTPDHIKDASKKALDDGYTHYGPAAGLPDVRAKIAEHVSETRGITVSPDNVVVTPGAKPIMYFTMTVLAEEGGEVISPNPGFPIYESMINFNGGTAVPMRLHEEEGFRPDLDELRRLITPRTKLIVLNSPHNPTGGMLDRKDLETIAEMAIEHDLLVLSDEVYRDIIYDGSYFSIASLPGMQERTIILDGFSKTYAMTGWRLGYGVFPDELVPHVSRLMVNSVSCTAAFVQKAGIAAIEGPKIGPKQMVEEFKKRRDWTCDALNGIEGVRCFKPEGAFYVLPKVENPGKMVPELFRKHKVITYLGDWFAAAEAELALNA